MSAAAAAHAPPPRWVTFSLDSGRFALALDTVERVVRAVEITALPCAPDVIAGIIDVAGRTLPVFDLRRRLRLPPRELHLGDQFVIARTSRRGVVLLVDQVVDVIEAPAESLSRDALPADIAHLSGILATPDGLVFIEELEHFLSVAELESLDAALEAAGVQHAR